MKNKIIQLQTCKQCGHSQKYHAPYYNGKGWHCQKDNCIHWNICKKPKKQT